MPPTPEYWDHDGDWVKRHPVRLGDTTLYAFIVPADRAALSKLCQTWINDRPTGGTVHVAPLLPAVVLVYADIRRLRSDDEDHAKQGYLHEQDVAFFVPVTLKHKGQHKVASLVPYLFVDSGAGLIAGREIYGFPKELGAMSFHPDPLRFEAKSLVIAEYAADSPADNKLVVSLTSGRGVKVEAQLPSDRRLATAAMVGRALVGLGVNGLDVFGTAELGFDMLRLLFLKQFRDAVFSGTACHQSLLLAQGAIENLRDVAIHVGDFSVALPRYDSLKIAETLGLAEMVRVGLGFSMKLDLVVDRGELLWSAG